MLDSPAGFCAQWTNFLALLSPFNEHFATLTPLLLCSWWNFVVYLVFKYIWNCTDIISVKAKVFSGNWDWVTETTRTCFCPSNRACWRGSCHLLGCAHHQHNLGDIFYVVDMIRKEIRLLQRCLLWVTFFTRHATRPFFVFSLNIIHFESFHK